MSGKNKTTKHLVLRLWFITLHCKVSYCFVCGKYGIFTFFPPTDSCVYNDACLSGGHGGALAGVFVEAARVWAAEAPRPSAETSVRGDCTPVWVLCPNVLMLCPADGVLFVRAAATEHINCTVILASILLRQESFFELSLLLLQGFGLSLINFCASVSLKLIMGLNVVMFTPGILFSFDFNVTILLERDVIRDCLR